MGDFYRVSEMSGCVFRIFRILGRVFEEGLIFDHYNEILHYNFYNFSTVAIQICNFKLFDVLRANTFKTEVNTH